MLKLHGEKLQNPTIGNILVNISITYKRIEKKLNSK